MPAGKLTIQAWQEQQEREAKRQAKFEEGLRELDRQLQDLGRLLRPRRRISPFRRFNRTINFGL